jgi:hypothetical protein
LLFQMQLVYRYSESSDGGGEESDGEGEGDKIGHSYVLTSPPASLRLNPSDKLYVIATTVWV